MSSPLFRANSVSIDPYIQGDIAAGATDSGNPIKIGGLASSVVPTAVSSGQRVNAYFDPQGYLYTKSIAQGDAAHGSTDSGNPLKLGGIASASQPLGVAAGSRVNAYFDLNGRQHVVVDSIAGASISSGGTYNSSAPTLVSGQQTSFQLDVNGNEKVVEQYAPAYEDNTAGVAKVENRYSYNNITTATTTTVKSGAGFLHAITVNTTAAGTITIYDNTAGSGTKIGTLKASVGEQTFAYNVSFATGLTLVTAAASDVTVSYR